MFRRGWGDVMSEMDQMKGYPVKTVMSLEIGGENCTTTGGQPIATDTLGNSVGGSIAGSAVLFKITSELLAINEDDVAAVRFVVPVGWQFFPHGRLTAQRMSGWHWWMSRFLNLEELTL